MAGFAPSDARFPPNACRDHRDFPRVFRIPANILAVEVRQTVFPRFQGVFHGFAPQNGGFWRFFGVFFRHY
jgi:hypothetical protein